MLSSVYFVTLGFAFSVVMSRYTNYRKKIFMKLVFSSFIKIFSISKSTPIKNYSSEKRASWSLESSPNCMMHKTSHIWTKCCALCGYDFVQILLMHYVLKLSLNFSCVSLLLYTYLHIYEKLHSITQIQDMTIVNIHYIDPLVDIKDKSSVFTFKLLLYFPICLALWGSTSWIVFIVLHRGLMANYSSEVNQPESCTLSAIVNVLQPKTFSRSGSEELYQ